MWKYLLTASAVINLGLGIGLWMTSGKLTALRKDHAVVLDRNDTFKKSNTTLTTYLGQCNAEKIRLVDEHNREVENYVNFNAQNAKAMAPALERLASLSQYWRVVNQKPITVSRTGGTCEARLANIQEALGQYIGRVRDAN